MSGPARNIYQRLAAVMERVEYIKKEKAVSTGGEGSYKAVTHDQVAGMVRGEFQKNGIVVAPTLVEHTLAETGQKSSKGAAHVRLEVVYDVAFVNADAPDDRVVVRVLAHGIDAGDKAPGKVLSYAVKYAILKVLLIETGENDESRYGDDEDDLPAEKIAEIDAALRSCESRADLQKYLQRALAVAEESGDRYAARHFNETAKAVGQKLPEVKQPQAKKPAGDAATASTPDPSAEKAPREAPSAGLLASIRNIAKRRDLTHEGLMGMANLPSSTRLEDLDKAKAAAILRALNEAQS